MRSHRPPTRGQQGAPSALRLPRECGKVSPRGRFHRSWGHFHLEEVKSQEILHTDPRNRGGCKGQPPPPPSKEGEKERDGTEGANRACAGPSANRGAADTQHRPPPRNPLGAAPPPRREGSRGVCHRQNYWPWDDFKTHTLPLKIQGKGESELKN